MKRFFLVAGCWFCFLLRTLAVAMTVTGSFAQTVNQKLQKAFQQFENNGQLKYAMSSLYVIDAKTGKIVFDKNSRIGLAPASTQKIITSVTAFELLGKSYKYKTEFHFTKDLHLGSEAFYIAGSGDPTFGSWRYKSTTDSVILKNVFGALKSKADKKIENLIVNDDLNDTPGGWVWEDIGNYYGAASHNLNWRENQYDLLFKSGKPGHQSEIIRTSPEISNVVINNQVISGPVGSGDNAYIYPGVNNDTILVKGTIPPDRNNFSISGAMPDPTAVFLEAMVDYFSDKSRYFPIKISKVIRRPYFGNISDQLNGMGASGSQNIYTHYSPPLDSIIYWFLKKSINLYGESLIKTFNINKSGSGIRDTGIAYLKRFWVAKGIDEDELNIYDGSGLSPLNRVTTHAQVEILRYARGKSWYSSFYDALPEFNNMKMKSGTITDVKGFCGYHKAKDGKEYIFSFLVNNYNGSSSALVNKMYKVLDVLK